MTYEKYFALLNDSSRVAADTCVELIVSAKEEIGTFIEISFLDNGRVASNASRVVWLAGTDFPKMITEHVDEIIERLPQIKTEGVRRNYLNLLANAPLKVNEESWGRLLTLSFDWLANPASSIAVKVYCMKLLVKIGQLYPEILSEAELLIEEQLHFSSPAIQIAAKKTLAKIRKMKFKIS